MSFFESLNPIIGYWKREDDWYAFIFRVLIAVGFFSAAGHYYFYPEHFRGKF
jgi:hypothetical protein